MEHGSDQVSCGGRTIVGGGFDGGEEKEEKETKTETAVVKEEGRPGEAKLFKVALRGLQVVRVVWKILTRCWNGGS